MNLRDAARAPRTDDIVGRHALMLLEAAYLTAQSRPQTAQRDIDDLREAVCLAHGWEFRL